MWNFQFFFNKIKPVETLSLDPTTCLYLKIFRSFKGKRPRQPPTAQSYSTFGNAWNNNLMSLHGRLEKYSSWFELAWNSKNDPKKSKERGRRAPRDNVLPDKFQKVAAFLGPRKLLCFSAKSEGSRPWSRFVCSYMQKFSCSPCSSWLFADALYTRWKDSISEQNARIPAITSPLNTLNLSQVS